MVGDRWGRGGPLREWALGQVGSAEDGRAVRSEATGDDPDALGQLVARQLLELGAGALLHPRT